MNANKDKKYAEVMEAAHAKAWELGLDGIDIISMLGMDLAGCMLMAGLNEAHADEVMRACFERARELLAKK